MKFSNLWVLSVYFIIIGLVWCLIDYIIEKHEEKEIRSKITDRKEYRYETSGISKFMELNSNDHEKYRDKQDMLKSGIDCDSIHDYE